jgi:hypothetical protein
MIDQFKIRLSMKGVAKLAREDKLELTWPLLHDLEVTMEPQCKADD